MSDVCIITGGGSGMGFEAAKILGEKYSILITGRTPSKLEHAVAELKRLGIKADFFSCDVSNRNSVRKLREFAEQIGTIKVLIHSAGVSPHMADYETIFQINAMGTIYVDEEFLSVMDDGCILNVASMSAYMVPASMLPINIYPEALADPAHFMAEFQKYIAKIPAEKKTGMAYTVSKNFVIWYTAAVAISAGEKGVRVISISPGMFKTPMQDQESEESLCYALEGPLKRLGEPEEIAKMMAFMVSEECSYLCGTDILYDGGAVAKTKIRRSML